jgi:hypothetical protein
MRPEESVNISETSPFYTASSGLLVEFYPPLMQLQLLLSYYFHILIVSNALDGLRVLRTHRRGAVCRVPAPKEHTGRNCYTLWHSYDPQELAGTECFGRKIFERERQISGRNYCDQTQKQRQQLLNNRGLPGKGLLFVLYSQPDIQNAIDTTLSAVSRSMCRPAIQSPSSRDLTTHEEWGGHGAEHIRRGAFVYRHPVTWFPCHHG